ncbi:980_t:CDS:2 [Entrophospora sp. SA101]|nr:980_t:CDS:2 [Entrophospora sp. SA101]
MDHLHNNSLSTPNTPTLLHSEQNDHNNHNGNNSNFPLSSSSSSSSLLKSPNQIPRKGHWRKRKPHVSLPPIQIQRNPKHSQSTPSMSSEECRRKLNEELEKVDFDDITVSELKELLRQRGKPATGKKSILMQRLQEEIELQFEQQYQPMITSQTSKNSTLFAPPTLNSTVNPNGDDVPFPNNCMTVNNNATGDWPDVNFSLLQQNINDPNNTTSQYDFLFQKHPPTSATSAPAVKPKFDFVSLTNNHNDIVVNDNIVIKDEEMNNSDNSDNGYNIYNQQSSTAPPMFTEFENNLGILNYPPTTTSAATSHILTQQLNQNHIPMQIEDVCMSFGEVDLTITSGYFTTNKATTTFTNCKSFKSTYADEKVQEGLGTFEL